MKKLELTYKNKKIKFNITPKEYEQATKELSEIYISLTKQNEK